MQALLWLLVVLAVLAVLVVLVVLGIAAVAYLVRSRRRAAAPPVPAAPPTPDPDDIRRELADLLGSMVGTVSPDVLAKYESIHRRMLTMLPRMGSSRARRRTSSSSTGPRATTCPPPYGATSAWPAGALRSSRYRTAARRTGPCWSSST